MSRVRTLLGVTALAAWLAAAGGCASAERAALAEAAAPAPDSVAWLASWMAGHWVGDDPANMDEEAWTGAEGGAMLGVNRAIRKGRMVAFEYLRLEPVEGGGVRYVAQPGGGPGTPFRLVATTVDPPSAVFENLEHDWPVRITYRRRGAALTAEAAGRTEQEPVLRFEWTRRD